MQTSLTGRENRLVFCKAIQTDTLVFYSSNTLYAINTHSPNNETTFNFAIAIIFKMQTERQEFFLLILSKIF